MQYPRAFSKTSNLKTKKPLGLLRQRPMSTFCSRIATCNSTGAAHGRDDDGVDAPGDGSKNSFAEARLAKRAVSVNRVNR
jgi:hypothetical protein